MTTSPVVNEFSSNTHYRNITCSIGRTQPLIHSIYSNIRTCLGRMMTITGLPTESDNHWAANKKSQNKSHIRCNYIHFTGSCKFIIFIGI